MADAAEHHRLVQGTALVIPLGFLLVAARRRRVSAAKAAEAIHRTNKPLVDRLPGRVREAVEEAADLLPDQGILENFVHHNPLHRFESLNFKQAIIHVDNITATMSPGARALSLAKLDPRERVNEALVNLSAAFLDRGAAKWTPGFRDKGFLHFFATLEPLGYAGWRRSARFTARRVTSAEADAELVLQENLEFFGVPPEEWASTIRAMLLDIRGWSGMFRRTETHPGEAPAGASVRLLDFCAVKSTLARSSIEEAARRSGVQPGESIAQWLRKAPLFAETGAHAEHPSAIAEAENAAEHRDALEAAYESVLLRQIGGRPSSGPDSASRPDMQMYMCIDDRAGSLRRHLEKLDHYETFGVAGFFGLPIRYQPADGRQQMVLAPEGVVPSVVMRETEVHRAAVHKRRRRVLSRLALAWERASFSPLGSAALSALAPVSLGRLWLMGFWPGAKDSLKERALHALLPPMDTDFDLPFSAQQAAQLLALTFQDIGTTGRFAPLVLVVGHGASSVNNPYASAYNCGACSGRQGGPNARLLARTANDARVRKELLEAHGIQVPPDTVFVGAMHDTTQDAVTLLDEDRVPESHRERLRQVKLALATACGDNALERCANFLLADRVTSARQALRHVRQRSRDAAEVRPELNHATNAAVIVGRRSLSRGVSLGRRAFLPSYEPEGDDPRGTNLEHVLAPALLVASGINLEYLFSTIHADTQGAGTKAPLNVVGLLGVQQGTSGDLRVGLPAQMTEMHQPLRATYIVDAPVERVEQVLRRREDLSRLVRNDWVRFIVRDPESGRFFRQQQGEYQEIPVDSATAAATPEAPPSETRVLRGRSAVRMERAVYRASLAGMLASCAVPLYLFAGSAMNPYGAAVALGGTALALPVLSFSRRYLHGERMYARFAGLSTALLLGFNMVALAPSMHLLVSSWSLFGFASTFLIGAYNERPSVRKNATFAFAAYQLSDMAMLTSAAYCAHAATEQGALVAGGLLVAALMKSSQFPLMPLFARSMEGPTPTSALGYAGLSAHAGVALLAATTALWFPYDAARLTLGSLGAASALCGSMLARIRPDRKGAVAYATSAAIGPILVALAAGYTEGALLMSLGHASFRVVQVLRSSNIIADTQAIRDSLGAGGSASREVPQWLYKAAWRLKRLDNDTYNALLDSVDWKSGRLGGALASLSRAQQWALTGGTVVLAGFPFTPLSDAAEERLLELLPAHPALGAALMAAKALTSVLLVRTLFYHVLTPSRFASSAKLKHKT